MGISKYDLYKMKIWSLYASFILKLILVITLVVIIIYNYYSGSTPEIRYSDSKAVINYLLDNGIPAIFGALFALYLK